MASDSSLPTLISELYAQYPRSFVGSILYPLRGCSRNSYIKYWKNLKFGWNSKDTVLIGRCFYTCALKDKV